MTKRKDWRATAYNKRFGEIDVKVITRTLARPLDGSDSLNGVQSISNFAKPPGRYRQTNESAMGITISKINF